MRLGLTGTKVSCAQARCGACTVKAVVDAGAGDGSTKAVTVNAVRNSFEWIQNKFRA